MNKNISLDFTYNKVIELNKLSKTIHPIDKLFGKHIENFFEKYKLSYKDKVILLNLSEKEVLDYYFISERLISELNPFEIVKLETIMKSLLKKEGIINKTQTKINANGKAKIFFIKKMRRSSKSKKTTEGSEIIDESDESDKSDDTLSSKNSEFKFKKESLSSKVSSNSYMTFKPFNINHYNEDRESNYDVDDRILKVISLFNNKSFLRIYRRIDNEAKGEYLKFLKGEYRELEFKICIIKGKTHSLYLEYKDFELNLIKHKS